MQRSLNISLLCFGAFVFSCSDSGPTPPPANDPIVFETASLPAGQQGVSYSAEIFAKGGSGDGYRWSVIGSLPAGLFMSSRGMTLEDGRVMTTILGTPLVNGDFTFSVGLTDDDDGFEKVELSITLQAAPPELMIITQTLPDGGTETAYSAQLEATNGAAPLSWSQISGSLPPGITLAATGLLSGMPEEAGEFPFDLRVSDADGQSASASYKITVQDESLPLAMVTTDLPDGVVDLPFSAEIEGQNGSPPYAWQLIGDAPPGLSIDATGNPVNLAGTPTLNGNYTFQIEVEDSAQARVRRTFFVEIVRAPPPVRITSLSVPRGEVNSPYSAEISAVNGSGSGYTWRVSQGALPPGLALADMGTPATTLSGTPTQSGTFDFTVEVRDDAGRVHEADFSVLIIPEIFPIQITTTSTQPGPVVTLPSTRLGESYDFVLTAQDGFGQYHWVVSAGRLPAGLQVQVDGTPSSRVTGLAGERGTFPFTVTVYDDNNVTASKDFSLTVNGPEFPVNMVTSSIPNAKACNAYGVDIVAQQGSNVDYSWSIIAGALPPGMTLDATGTPATKIRGTAIEGTTGTYNFTVQVTDSAGDVSSQAFTMNIVDDGTGDRWVVMVGDMFNDNRYDLAVSNICRTVPSQALQASPVGTTGDADTGTSDFMLSPDGTKVAFTGDFRVVGFDEVWVTDVTGTPPFTPVIVSPAVASDTLYDAFDLKWAPDSNHLVFMGDFTVDGVNELYAVDTSAGLVANSAIPIAPSLPSTADVDSQDYVFSPDGRYVAYAVDTHASSAYDLWVYDLNAAVQRSAVKVNPDLPSTSADVNYPVTWSPDSSSILYNCDCNVALRDELFLATISGTTVTSRTVSHNFTTGNVRWTSSEVAPTYSDFTKDGNWIYYFGDAGNTAQGDTLYAVDTRVPNAVGVPVFNAPASNAQDIFYVRKGPGSTVIAMGDIEVSSLNELYAFDLASPFPVEPGGAKVSGLMQPNGDVSSYTDFEISPDGNYVVFTADKDIDGHDAAYLVDLRPGATPGPVQISDNTIADINLDVFNIYWSPASNWVALYGDLVINSDNEVYGVNVAAGPPYTQVTLSAPLISGSDVNSPVIWRGDGGGIIYEADHEQSSQDEAWWVDVTNPGVATRLTSVPTNGDVFVIKTQGQ